MTDCADPGGRVPAPFDTDCDDRSPNVRPGAPEVCNDIDDDGDVDIDEQATDAETYYPDRDRDGYGAGGGTASGPVSFMKGYDAFAGVVKSGGKTRRAAKMVILDAGHPDVELGRLAGRRDGLRLGQAVGECGQRGGEQEPLKHPHVGGLPSRDGSSTS